MDHSPQLKAHLKKISGINKVYFNPPEGTKLEYPCLKANLRRRDAVYANNKKYIKDESYVIYFITRDSKTAPAVMDQLEELPFCTFDTSYVKDGLHHYVYKINY